MDSPFSIGIEEEFFVVNRKTRTPLPRMPARFLGRCRHALGAKVDTELLQSQIEVKTGICHSIEQAQDELGELRQTLAGVADAFGLAIIASGTHPMAEWREQLHTEKERYRQIADDLQFLARRNLLCGLHVHVGVPYSDARIDLMNRALPFLPLLLALSTSSPFWGGRNTGMKFYRLAAYDELPRTGLPPFFENDAAYRDYVDVLVAAGAIKDATHIWWAIRPSASFPTLELRIADSTTRLADALAIAAIYRCLIRLLHRRPEIARDRRSFTLPLIDENRWLAQRYGLDGILIDPGMRQASPCREQIAGLLDLLAEDAAFFGCEAQFDRARAIMDDGTSADRQLQIYRAARDEGVPRVEALKRVVDWQIEETRKRVDRPA